MLVNELKQGTRRFTINSEGEKISHFDPPTSRELRVAALLETLYKSREGLGQAYITLHKEVQELGQMFIEQNTKIADLEAEILGKTEVINNVS